MEDRPELADPFDGGTLALPVLWRAKYFSKYARPCLEVCIVGRVEARL